MKKIIIFTIGILFSIPIVIFAASNITFSSNTTINDITLGAGTTTLLVFSSSAAESATVQSGQFEIKNPDPNFHIGSADSAVKSIKATASSTGSFSCTANTTPGTTYITLSTTTDIYIVSPTAVVLDTHAATYNSSCGAATCVSGYQVSGSGASAFCSTCAPLNAATSYNSSCGAATCNAGYSVSGSGASAVCNANSSGSAGGGGVSKPDPNNSTTTVQYYLKQGDGTVINTETRISKVKGVAIRTSQDALISLPEKITKGMSVSLLTFMTSEVKETRLDLNADLLQNFVDTYGSSKNLDVKVISINANEEQKTNEARSGMFLMGFDIFTFEIKMGTTNITTFSSPLKLSFDVSAIKDKEELKIYYYNTSAKKWVLAGNGGNMNGNMLEITVDHLTDFALMKKIEDVSETEILSDRALEWQQLLEDAGSTLDSGTNLEKFIIYNSKTKNVDAQKSAMQIHTNKIVGDSKITINQKYAINNFIVYGTLSTQTLGIGERAGAVNSFQTAFGKLPITYEDWVDCSAIAIGRWPAKTSEKALKKANEQFVKIYKRNANMNNTYDNAAVTVMAYGLRPLKRNTNSEARAVKIFKGIFKYSPSSASDWDAVRAIAYSGAKR